MDNTVYVNELPIDTEYRAGVESVVDGICRQLASDLPHLDRAQHMVLVLAASPTSIRGMLIPRASYRERPIGANHAELLQEMAGVVDDGTLIPLVIVSPKFESLILLRPGRHGWKEYPDGDYKTVADPVEAAEVASQLSADQMSAVNDAMESLLNTYARMVDRPPLDKVCAIVTVHEESATVCLIDRDKCTTRQLPQELLTEMASGEYDKARNPKQLLTFVVTSDECGIGVCLFDFDPINLTVNASGGES